MKNSCVEILHFLSVEIRVLRRNRQARGMVGGQVTTTANEGIQTDSTTLTSLISVDPPRGTRDFPPEDMRLRSWLFQHFREVQSLQPYSLVALVCALFCESTLFVCE